MHQGTPSPALAKKHIFHPCVSEALINMGPAIYTRVDVQGDGWTQGAGGRGMCVVVYV
jgi:hypothetical protein